MSIYKKVSAKTGKISWLCSFYYKDSSGQRHQKKKEGFSSQREAKQFERDFLAQYEASINTPFKDFIKAYLADKDAQYRATTKSSVSSLIETRLTPFFGNMPICEITPAHVRRWQNELTGQQLQPSTIKRYKQALSAIFNYACQLYGLKSNPARLAGSADTRNYKAEKRPLHFWTAGQFQTFAKALEAEATENTPIYSALFALLFYSGLRIGEALALTPADIDTKANIIHVNKTARKLAGVMHVNPPKTPAGNRNITMPESIIKALADIIRAQQGRMTQADAIFQLARSSIKKRFYAVSASAGLPHIRVHDLRHSHASLLIEKGFSPLAIKDRLGHESIEITLNTYSHLYPNKQSEIAEALQEIITPPDASSCTGGRK